MEYYAVINRPFIDDTGKVLGNPGDVLEFPTDSTDKKTRLAAEGMLRGHASGVLKLDGKPAAPEPKPKSKTTKKKATYKTKEATPEG
jgi:hypothetical protein